jgi:hypothetical protein
MFNLLKDCLIVKASNGAAAGTSEVDSSIIDLGSVGGVGGFDAITWIVDLGTVTSTCVLTAQAQQNSLNQTSGMANVGTAATITDAGGATSNKLLVTEVIVPSKRYHRLALTRTTANAVVNTIIAILHRSKDRPVTPDASVAASALSVGN